MATEQTVHNLLAAFDAERATFRAAQQRDRQAEATDAYHTAMFALMNDERVGRLHLAVQAFLRGMTVETFDELSSALDAALDQD